MKVWLFFQMILLELLLKENKHISLIIKKHQHTTALVLYKLKLNPNLKKTTYFTNSLSFLKTKFPSKLSNKMILSVVTFPAKISFDNWFKTSR